MTRSCKSCIHRQVCEIYDVTNEPLEAIGCVHFLDAADVVPKSEVELLKRQLEPFKEKQCFTCKHYDIGHDHVPCCFCKDYDKYIWLSADADTDIHTSDESEVDKCKTEVAREIFAEIRERLSSIVIHADDVVDYNVF